MHIQALVAFARRALGTYEALRSMEPACPYNGRARQAQEAAETSVNMNTVIVIYASYFRQFQVRLVRRPGQSLVNVLEPLEFICAITEPLRLSHYDVNFAQETAQGLMVRRPSALAEGMFAVVHRRRTPVDNNTILSYQSNSSLALVRLSDMDSIASISVNVTQDFDIGDWMNPELSFQIHTVTRAAGDTSPLITTIYTCRVIPDLLYDLLEANLESFDC
jgi:hypothetical protein